MASLRHCLALVAGTAVTLTLCTMPATAGPVPTSAVTPTATVPADPPAPAIPQRYLDQPISWALCSFDATIKRLHPGAPDTNCANVKVPMDWNQPDAHPDIQVAIAY